MRDDDGSAGSARLASLPALPALQNAAESTHVCQLYPSCPRCRRGIRHVRGGAVRAPVVKEQAFCFRPQALHQLACLAHTLNLRFSHQRTSAQEPADLSRAKVRRFISQSVQARPSPGELVTPRSRPCWGSMTEAI